MKSLPIAAALVAALPILVACPPREDGDLTCTSARVVFEDAAGNVIEEEMMVGTQEGRPYGDCSLSVSGPQNGPLPTRGSISIQGSGRKMLLRAEGNCPGCRLRYQVSASWECASVGWVPTRSEEAYASLTRDRRIHRSAEGVCHLVEEGDILLQAAPVTAICTSEGEPTDHAG